MYKNRYTWLVVVVLVLSPIVARAMPTHPPVKKGHIVFLITEDPDNYEAHKTVPVFAHMLRQKYGYKVTVLLGSGRHGAYRYPDISPIKAADLVVIFARRIALPFDQMNALKKYVDAGKPLVGIRTANHAFTPRDSISAGYEAWPEFVSDVLGCENRGYGPVEPGMDLSVTSEGRNHPILKGVTTAWHSKGNIYLVDPLLDPKAVVLLTGKANTIIQPVAWTRLYGKSRVFYTSLGYPADFSMAPFTTMLVNGIQWAMNSNIN